MAATRAALRLRVPARDTRAVVFICLGARRATCPVHAGAAAGEKETNGAVSSPPRRSTAARLALGPWRWEWSLEEGGDGGGEEEEKEPAFADARIAQLPFFKFVHVDDAVAVAQGRSGGVAVWARVDVAEVEGSSAAAEEGEPGPAAAPAVARRAALPRPSVGLMDVLRDPAAYMEDDD